MEFVKHLASASDLPPTSFEIMKISAGSNTRNNELRIDFTMTGTMGMTGAQMLEDLKIQASDPTSRLFAGCVTDRIHLGDKLASTTAESIFSMITLVSPNDEDFNELDDEGSQARIAFISALCADLARASDQPEASFVIKRIFLKIYVTILVDIEITTTVKNAADVASLGPVLPQTTWGGRILTLHLDYVAGYIVPLLFLLKRTHKLGHNYPVRVCVALFDQTDWGIVTVPGFLH